MSAPSACSAPATPRATTSSRPGCRTTTTIPTRRRSTGWRWRAARRARATSRRRASSAAPPGSPTFAAARTVTGADAAPRRRAARAPAADGRRWRLQRRLRAARPQVDGRRCWARRKSSCGAAASAPARSRPIRSAACRCRSMSARRPTPTGTPASPPSPAATWPRPPAASSWWPMRRPTRPRPGRWRPAPSGRRAPTCWPAIRRNSRPISSAPPCTAAPSTAWSPRRRSACRSSPNWNVPPLDRKRADMLRNDRVGRRALALFQLGAATAAERELFAASLDADPQYHRGGPGGRPEGRAARACRSGSATPPGTSATRSRAMTARCIRCRRGSRPRGFSVDKALVYGFMRQESAFNPKARSYVGAMGLMQLMPATARLVANKYAPEAAGGNPYDPSINISLGQAYIASLLGDVDNNLVRTVAGYNGGPGNVNALGQFAERLGGSAALHRLDPAQRDARLRAAGAGQLLDVPDPARPADAVARPDRGARMAALHRAGRRRPLMRRPM